MRLFEFFLLQMSDYEDNDDDDMAPNYDKMRGMGFICWREIPGTNDEVGYSNFSLHSMCSFVQEDENVQVNKKNKKRKLETIEIEQDIETPVKSEQFFDRGKKRTK